MQPALRIAVVVNLGIALLAIPANAQQPAPQVRAISGNALRRVIDETALPPVTAAEKGPAPRQSDWSDVRDLEGEEIVLTLIGALPVTRYVVANSVNDAGLVVLNLTDARIPPEAKTALADAAWSHPEYFTRPQQPPGRLDQHVRIEAGGVFVDNNKVIDLADIVEQVARTSVAEITYTHHAAKRGTAWGALAGFAAGMAIVAASCGTHWNHETESCGNLTGAWLFLGPGFGAGIGAAIGAGTQVTTVVYRATPGGA